MHHLLLRPIGNMAAAAGAIRHHNRVRPGAHGRQQCGRRHLHGNLVGLSLAVNAAGHAAAAGLDEFGPGARDQ